MTRLRPGQPGPCVICAREASRCRPSRAAVTFATYSGGPVFPVGSPVCYVCADDARRARYVEAPTRLRPGTLVQLDDNTLASATYDAREGTYRTSQRNPVTGGMRVDTGWRREQLTEVRS